MKRSLIASFVALFLVSCGSTPELYYWGGNSNGASAYENATYYYYKHQDPQSLCSLICTMEDMVRHPGGTRKTVPPGVCAEYAYILTLQESVEAFNTAATAKQRKVFGDKDPGIYFPQHAKEMLEKEMELYPESKAFLEPIVKKLIK